MSTASIHEPAPCEAAEPSAARSGYVFAAVAAAVAIGACLLAGWMPLGFSIVMVFLFAGPHNWFEARYMLTRMPARWGPLRMYFLSGIAGVLLLTGTMAVIPWLGQRGGWSDETWQSVQATWNTALITWVVALVLMRSRQNPRRNWTWAVPIGLVIVGLNWLWPYTWTLALVYLHPLMALWFLDREIGRMQPVWQPAYRACFVLVPLLLGLLWWRLADAADLPGADLVSRTLRNQIAQHAGEGLVRGISTHFLIAAHTFLEMLHYGVWIVAIPLVSIRMVPWRLDNVPLARRSPAWRWAILGAVGFGVLVMLGLWGAFLTDYPLTRDVYFTIAMLHVLAEVPFLLRLL